MRSRRIEHLGATQRLLTLAAIAQQAHVAHLELGVLFER